MVEVEHTGAVKTVSTFCMDKWNSVAKRDCMSRKNYISRGRKNNLKINF